MTINERKRQLEAEAWAELDRRYNPILFLVAVAILAWFIAGVM